MFGILAQAPRTSRAPVVDRALRSIGVVEACALRGRAATTTSLSLLERGVRAASTPR